MLLVAVMVMAGIAASSPASALGPTFSGFGTAEIDGSIAGGEYTECRDVTLQTLLGTPPSGAFRAQLCIMNDETNLYIAVRIENDPTQSENDAVSINFDRGDGVQRVGDDALIARILIPTPSFQDGVVSEVANNQPALIGGDGNHMTATITPSTHTFEISKLLCSGDTLDFCLDTDDLASFCLIYGDPTTSAFGAYPVDCASGSLLNPNGSAANDGLIRIIDRPDPRETRNVSGAIGAILQSPRAAPAPTAAAPAMLGAPRTGDGGLASR